jgi:non-heme chloroperoxidase
MRRILFSLAAVAGVSWASRAFVRWLEAQPERYSPTQLHMEPQGIQHFIDRPDGTRLRAIVAGHGPTVVLAHGFGISLLEWNIVWEPLLAAGFRVICFDQRGHAQSTIGSDGISTHAMAGDYLAVLEYFNVVDGILVGHSMGGFLAIAAVLEQPGVAERLRGLVLFSTFAGRLNEGAPQN